MLPIIFELSSFLPIHSLSTVSFIGKTAKKRKKKKKKGKGRERIQKKVVSFLLELEDAIISKVNNHNGSIGRHGHTGGAIHLSEAAPLRSEFA